MWRYFNGPSAEVRSRCNPQNLNLNTKEGRCSELTAQQKIWWLLFKNSPGLQRLSYRFQSVSLGWI